MLRVSLRDISSACGYSVCTVSKALRGDPVVAVATRRAIQALAKEMGYRPSPALSRVMGRRIDKKDVGEGETLAFIQNAPRVPNAGLGVLTGARRRAEAMGYHVEEFRMERVSSNESLLRMMDARGVRGILLGAWLGEGADSFVLPWHRYAVVSCEHDTLPVHFYRVRVSYFKGLTHALERLAAGGFQRIGVVLNRAVHGSALEEDFRSQIGAVSGTRQWGSLRSKVVAPLILATQDPSRMRAWLQKTRPDVVVGQTVNEYWILREMGYEMPGDFGFAVVYRPRLLDRWSEGIAGMALHAEDVGSEAVRLVDSMLRHGDHGVPALRKEVLLPIDFVWDRSLGRPEPEPGSGDRLQDLV